MSPVQTVALTFVGVLAAGLPLLWLTAPVAAPAAQTNTALPPQKATVYATLQFSGNPHSIILRHQGETLATFTAPESPLETELLLPTTDTIELEAEVHGAELCNGAQALTITLEPAGREPRSETRWGDALLHDIFRFTW